MKFSFLMKTDERCYVEIPSVKCIRKEILIWYAHSLYDVRVVWSLLSVSVICVRVCVLPQAVKEVGGECGSRAGDRAATVISLTSHWSEEQDSGQQIFHPCTLYTLYFSLIAPDRRDSTKE